MRLIFSFPTIVIYNAAEHNIIIAAVPKHFQNRLSMLETNFSLLIARLFILDLEYVKQRQRDILLHSYGRLCVHMLTNRLVCFDVLRSTSTHLPERWMLSCSAGLTRDWTSSASLRRGMKTLMVLRFVVCWSTVAAGECSSRSAGMMGRRPTTSSIRITVEWR